MNKNHLSKTLLAATVLAIVSCTNARTENAATGNAAEQISSAMPDTSKPAKAIFDGKSLSGWHGYNKTGEVKNWIIEDGALVCLGAAQHATGGDLVTDKDYE